jgi:alanyl-tRNA synthetase
VGYDTITCDARPLVMVIDGKAVLQASAGDLVEIVTDRTPFYGEAGGQVGDIGKITGDGFEIDVLETVKDPTGIIIHKGKVLSGTIQTSDAVTLTVDRNTRDAIARNHTATHILHSVLRQVLGDHVKQSGSLVAADRLRFDFTHFSQLDDGCLDLIEQQVNRRICENMPAHVEEMDAEEAFQSDATALFEEKYGDRVRVVSLDKFSKELCGGTHTGRTGDIGLFKIVGEASVASGIRRIEALTGAAALSHVQKAARILRETGFLLKEHPDNVTRRINKTLAGFKAAEKEVEMLKAQIASLSSGDPEDEVQSVNGINVLAKKVSVDSPAALRDLADKIKDKISSGVVALGSVSGSKVFLVVVVTKDLTDRLHAGKIIKQVAAAVGGSGGGRPDMAQAGGTRPEMLDQALAEVHTMLAGTQGA